MKILVNTKFLIGLILSFLIYLSFVIYGSYSKKLQATQAQIDNLLNNYKTVISNLKSDTYLYMNDIFLDRKEELVDVYPYLSDIEKTDKCGIESFYLKKDGICYGYYTHHTSFSAIFDGDLLDEYLNYFDIVLCKENKGFGRYKDFCGTSSFKLTYLNLLLPIKAESETLLGGEIYAIIQIPLIELFYFIISFIILYFLLLYRPQKNPVSTLKFHDNSTKKIDILKKEIKLLKEKNIDLENENKKNTAIINKSQKVASNIEQKKVENLDTEESSKLKEIQNIIYAILSNSIKPLKSKSRGIEIVSPPKIKRYTKALGLLHSFFDTVSLFVKTLPDMKTQDVWTVKEILHDSLKKMMLNLHVLEEELLEIGLSPMVEELEKINLLKKENTSLVRQIDRLKLDTMELNRLKLGIERILSIIEGEGNGK